MDLGAKCSYQMYRRLTEKAVFIFVCLPIVIK